MKILITGDIHGKLDLLEQVIKKHEDVDYHLNTGDLGISVNEIERNDILAVKGNTDIYSNVPTKRLLKLEDQVILLTHGHLENVKYGLKELEELAKNSHADICIFGHTHVPYIKKVEGILYLNPGSLKEFPYTYIILEDEKAEVYHL